MQGGRKPTVPGDVLLVSYTRSARLIPNPVSLPKQMLPVWVLWGK